MDIPQITLMTAAALVLGRLARKKCRTNLLLLASVFAVFWLQPALRLRYLDFILPVVSIGITTFVWAATSSQESRRHPETKISAALIFGFILLLSLTRYLNIGGFIPVSHPPAIGQVIFILGFFAAGTMLLARAKTSLANSLLWMFFFIILALLLTLKTPALSLEAGRGWRFFVNQNIDLASALDLHWLGYSYIAFRLLHTIRDRQSGLLPDVTLGEYVTYVIFFPAFSAGPIDRIERFINGLRQPANPLIKDFEIGGERLIVGIFKKFIIADTLGMIALNSINATQSQTLPGAWVLIYAYTLQIYFDFSGYTDIAIGLAQLMGITLPENFKQPYHQPNLTLFWNNWHITLTQWMRAYFFNPFTRALRSKKIFSADTIILITQVTTMTLIGLWHGIAWNFVLWGLWHGVGLFMQNRWSNWIKPRLTEIRLNPYMERLAYILGMAATFHYVALGWVWFVLPDPKHGWRFILNLFGAA